MKKIYILFLLVSFVFQNATAQNKIKESTETIEDLNGNALTIEIIRADEKDIEREWKSIMKSYEGKVKTKGSKILTSDAKIESISSGNVQVNARIGKMDGNKRKFTVIFKSERGAVSSSDDISGYTAVKSILLAFAKKLSVEAATEHKKLQEKALNDLIKEKEDLAKSNENLLSKIEEWKKDIEEAQYQIENNIKSQELNIKKLAEQQKIFEESAKELNSINN